MTTLDKDIKAFAEQFAQQGYLRDQTLLVTGATGLIGSILVKSLLKINVDYSLNLNIVCPVRNLRKVWTLYADLPVDAQVEWMECEDLATFDYADVPAVDYIFHLASPTASRFFTEHPATTLSSTFMSSYRLLELARRQPRLKGFVYVSSLESYGSIMDPQLQPIGEERQGYVNPMEARSCYPMAKRAIENLCHDYAVEHGVPTRVARLTQTFGAGVSPDDNRVFAQFARSILRGEDIVLHTTGESAKPYCYTTDCVAALLQIALFGANGEAYNVAHPETYISIRDMAEVLCQNFNRAVKVRVELHPEMGYAPVTRLPLSVERLIALGWTPRVGLVEMFRRLMEAMKE